MERVQVIEDLRTLKEAFIEESNAYPICIEEAIRLLEQSNNSDTKGHKPHGIQ